MNLKMKIFLVFLVLSALHVSSSLAVKQSYVVYMGAHSHGPEATTEDFNGVTDYHHSFLANFLGSHEKARDAIFDSYTRVINGFAANLDEHQAKEIAKHPDVVSVFLNKGKKKHTTHSWDFLLLENNGIPSEEWATARFGEDTIIGNLDTGVWPESESFNDIGYGPVPSRWKGSCEHYSNETNGVHCNRKLIGARHFNKGYKSNGGNVPIAMESARDFDGHGSHTLSTAGGNFVPATINGNFLGIAKGGSPRARVASYKVCWEPIEGNECFDSDIIAAFDRAIHDGVDVLSLSLGGNPVDYFADGNAIGAFHAIQNGVVVVCSAGNSGNDPGTVTNVAPWIFTVAASSMDREFDSFVKLGNGHLYKGASLSQALPRVGPYALISAADARAANASAHDALLCKPGTLDEKKAKGKIVACLRGVTARLDKGNVAKLAGAAGMILCNGKEDGNETIADLYVLPAVHVNYKDGSAIFNYINSTNNPLGYFTAFKASFDVKPAPSMAPFSSVGPNTVTPQILKPDITAPGVTVVAAYSQGVSPTAEPYDHRKLSFAVESGTSMSCPHISGIVGLLKTLNPTWSPAAIRSAIMTTAKTRDNTIKPMEDGDFAKATPFAYGAGHVRPNRAMDPGLVYDLTTTDYVHFLCAIGYNNTIIKTLYNGSVECSKSSSNTTTLLNFNYPSITVPELSGSVTVTRTLKNVGSPGEYIASVRHPSGVAVTVNPRVLKFDRVGEEKKFTVTLTSEINNSVDYKFGELLWSDGIHNVRSPIVVASSQ
ncbi:subtilisin-like protease SBT5.4 [Chenopodium quinoa]|uniref:Uncharacterized protein n=1 Tax=Chenopodium quinoa TaxID=63459 RepID=A0A803MWY4_CHEQI|nr:subtilisin-like protease SBT5.4 [Chenopodium quinoa]